MTATQEIISALAGSGLPQTDQAFFAAVAEGEGGTSFRVLYSGGDLLTPGNPNVTTVGKTRQWTGSLAIFPDWGGATAGQSYSTAAGAAQITHSTWDGPDHLARQFGLTDFEAQSQIQFTLKLATKRFPTLLAVLSAAANTPAMLALIPAALGKTWPGGCDAGFPKRYVKNLAALKNPAPPVEPPTMPTLASVTIPLPNVAQVTDGAGNTVSVPLKWTAAAAMVAMAALGSVAAFCGTGREAQPLVTQLIGDSPVAGDSTFVSEDVGLAVDRQSVDQAALSTPQIPTTFRMVPGPLGPLAVPLRK